MKSELKRLEIQRVEESKILSESDMKLAEEYGFSVKTYKIYVKEGYYVASNSNFAALLAKVREDERERCAIECRNQKVNAPSYFEINERLESAALAMEELE